MNNDMKGLCLFLGLIGVGYVAVLLLFVLFTGAKIIKSIIFISVFSLGLINIGLNLQVKKRLYSYLKTLSS